MEFRKNKPAKGKKREANQGTDSTQREQTERVTRGEVCGGMVEISGGD